MSFDELLAHVNTRLHDCVFCGLGKTEAIEFPPEFADELFEALLSAGVKFLMSDTKVVLFTTAYSSTSSSTTGRCRQGR